MITKLLNMPLSNNAFIACCQISIAFLWFAVLAFAYLENSANMETMEQITFIVFVAIIMGFLFYDGVETSNNASTNSNAKPTWNNSDPILEKLNCELGLDLEPDCFNPVWCCTNKGSYATAYNLYFTENPDGSVTSYSVFEQDTNLCGSFDSVEDCLSYVFQQELKRDSAEFLEWSLAWGFEQPNENMSQPETQKSMTYDSWKKFFTPKILTHETKRDHARISVKFPSFSDSEFATGLRFVWDRKNGFYHIYQYNHAPYNIKVGVEGSFNAVCNMVLLCIYYQWKSYQFEQGLDKLDPLYH